MLGGIFGAVGDISYKSKGSFWRAIGLDLITRALLFISYPHHEVHAGRFYRAGFAFSLANGEEAALAFNSPAVGGREMHMSIELHMTASGTFTWLEDLTSFSGGATLVPKNHNRNSSNTSDATGMVVGATGSNPVTLTGGNAIISTTFSVARDVNPSRAAGEEFIIKSGSKNAFRYVNGTSANFVHLILEWYEHTPKT